MLLEHLNSPKIKVSHTAATHTLTHTHTHAHTHTHRTTPLTPLPTHNSIIEMLDIGPNLTVLRTFRVLRPLRSLARFPGLRKILGALMDSIPDLLNVIILFMFFVICFSILGLVFWSGLLHARCRVTPYPLKFSYFEDNNCTSVNDDCWGELTAALQASYTTQGLEADFLGWDDESTFDDPYRVS